MCPGPERESTDPAGVAAADLGLLAPVWSGTAAETLSGDRSVLDHMVTVEVALLRALADVGIAPPETAGLAERLEGADLDGRDLALAATTGGNPVIPLVERLRHGLPDEQARWVHHGATSQDVVDTALMLTADRVLRRALQDLARLGDRLATLADEHRHTPAVARTLTQQAWPTTLGLRFAGWLGGVDDARADLAGCLPLPASLGGPVGTGAAYGDRGPALLEHLARELGLSAGPVSWHTARLPVLRVAAALAAVTGTCGKVAADVLVMSQTEVGEVAEHTGGGSSSMAHKANPAQSVLVAAAARQAPGLLATVAGSMPAEQERPAGAWHAEWQPLRDLLRLAGSTAERTAALVEGLRLDTERMARNLRDLTDRLGHDAGWAAAQTEHVDVWVDRALAAHRRTADSGGEDQ